MPATPERRVVTVTTTKGFLALAKDSKKRNRGPVLSTLEALDPEGTHVCAMIFPHNDVEWRAQWLVKVTGTMTPVTIWMDNGFDVFGALTSEIPVPCEGEA